VSAVLGIFHIGDCFREPHLSQSHRDLRNASGLMEPRRSRIATRDTP
jgi:hypothetical protein